MNRWPVKPLGELVNFVGGGTPRRDRPDFWGGDIPWASVKDLQGQSLETTIESITQEGLANSASNLIPKGTVIIASRVGLGKVAINRKPVAINQDLKALTPLTDDLLPRYLLHFLLSKTRFFEQAGVGATVKGLTLADYQRLPIPLPDPSEQKRIVDLLDDADELRKLRTQADSRAANLAPALFHNLFGDPATNPKGWPIQSVGELLIDCQYGSSQKPSEDPSGVPFIRMNNVTVAGNLDLSDLKYANFSSKDMAKYRLIEGDVIFNRTNSRDLVGKTGLWDGRQEAVAASYFIRLRFDLQREHPQHFTSFMNLPFMKSRLKEMARGAVGQANINAQELRSIKFPLPPISLQKTFATHMSEIRRMETSQASSRHRLDDLFQSLLDKAFKGEL
jgi:type I restriction enzyme S subunit